jgi:hypothetical protein
MTSLEALVGLSAVTIVIASSAPSALFVGRWGGTTKDIARALAVDSKQHVFVAGSTYSADFPTTTRREHANGNWCTFATNVTRNVFGRNGRRVSRRAAVRPLRRRVGRWHNDIA